MMLPPDFVRDMIDEADDKWPKDRLAFYSGAEWAYAKLHPRINDRLIEAVNNVLAQYDLDHIFMVNPNHPIIKLRDAARR